jgi:hypothetical protein
MENLLGIEMTLLTLGVFILCMWIVNIMANVLTFLQAIKQDENWRWNVLPHVLMLFTGIMLIIIATNL